MVLSREGSILFKKRRSVFMFMVWKCVIEKVVSDGSDPRCSDVNYFIMTVELPEFR